MPTLITNIKELLQIRDGSVSRVSGTEMKTLPTLKNAFLLIDDGLIKDFGKMEDLYEIQVNEVINAQGKMVLPTWCDSHTHIVYAGNREGEFVDRINGLTYEEIAAKGGGILNSAKKLQQTSEDDLYKQSAKRLDEVIKLGTGAVEIKSGYGLTTEAELKILRVIKKLAENYTITIKATFLGAHAFPSEFKNNEEGYVDLIINKMLPKIESENLAEFIDVFCEKGYFSVAETEKIIVAAKTYGLIPKIHVNQFNSIGGIQIGVKYNALSVDHLEVMTTEDIESLKNTSTMPVALPSCSYYLGIPYAPARALIDSGLP